MTTVRMPVRVRVEVADDRVDDDLVRHVTSAVEAALGRATDRALTVHAVTRAHRSPREPSATVEFTGDPLPGNVHAALESSLLTTLDLAAARLSLGTDRARDTLTSQAAAAGERLDDGRVVRDAGGGAGYRVPYYDRAGRSVDVRLHGLPADPAATGQPLSVPRLRRFATPDDLIAAVLAEGGGVPPTPFVVGHAAWTEGHAVLSFLDTGPDGALSVVTTYPLGVYVYVGGDRDAHLSTIGLLSADRWQRYGTATGATEVRALLTEVMVLDLQRDRSGTDPEQLRRQAAVKIRQVPEYGASTVTIYQLTSRGSLVWIGAADPGLPNGPIDVLILTEDVPDPGDEDTYGRCPPLDDGEADSWLAMLGLLHTAPATPGGPFLGEPSIVNWPPHISQRLEERTRHVAGLLHMEAGAFVGGFLLAAMVHIDRRCRLLARSGGPPGPQLQQMAAAFGPVRELFRMYVTLMLSQDDRKALPCPVAGRSRHWVSTFISVYSSARDDAVASMFVSTCQDVLLQTLFNSRNELSLRARNFAEYMPLTRSLMTVMLTDTVELMSLRDSLNARIDRERIEATTMGVFTGGAVSGQAWVQVTGLLVDSLATDLAGDQVSREPAAGTVARRGGTWQVYDGKGRWWKRDQLDALIAAQRQEAATVDPLLDKVVEIDELVVLLREAQKTDALTSTSAGNVLTSRVDDVFRDLIGTLLDENDRWLRKAAGDRNLAFGLANFRRADVRSASDLGAKLTGIHLLADKRLRAQFTDPEAYVSGVGRLAAVEIGEAELFEILSMVGITVLSIFCPPLGIAIGVAQGIHGIATAMEHGELQQAMLSGDEILSKAQVEAEMWAATISLALAVVPELPGAARGVAKFTGAAVKGEGTAFAAAATRAAMRDIVTHLAQLSVERFTKRFASEMAQGYLIDLALSKAMNRIADAVARQVEITGKASAGDVFEVLGRAVEGPRPPAERKAP
jgi:hypothetical protein